jgi:hypothetical protein
MEMHEIRYFLAASRTLNFPRYRYPTDKRKRKRETQT